MSNKIPLPEDSLWRNYRYVEYCFKSKTFIVLPDAKPKFSHLQESVLMKHRADLVIRISPPSDDDVVAASCFQSRYLDFERVFPPNVIIQKWISCLKEHFRYHPNACVAIQSKGGLTRGVFLMIIALLEMGLNRNLAVVSMKEVVGILGSRAVLIKYYTPLGLLQDPQLHPNPLSRDKTIKSRNRRNTLKACPGCEVICDSVNDGREAKGSSDVAHCAPGPSTTRKKLTRKAALATKNTRRSIKAGGPPNARAGTRDGTVKITGKGIVGEASGSRRARFSVAADKRGKPSMIGIITEDDITFTQTIRGVAAIRNFRQPWDSRTLKRDAGPITLQSRGLEIIREDNEPRDTDSGHRTKKPLNAPMVVKDGTSATAHKFPAPANSAIVTKDGATIPDKRELSFTVDDLIESLLAPGVGLDNDSTSVQRPGKFPIVTSDGDSAIVTMDDAPVKRDVASQTVEIGSSGPLQRPAQVIRRSSRAVWKAIRGTCTGSSANTDPYPYTYYRY